jgi:hypothetical protein
MVTAPKVAIFVGGEHCALPAIEFIAALESSLSQEEKDLFADVEGVGVPVHPNTMDERITGMQTIVTTLGDAFVTANNGLTQAQNNRLAQTEIFLKNFSAERKLLAAKLTAYTAAGEAILKIFRTNGGQVVQTALVTAAADSPDRML